MKVIAINFIGFVILGIFIALREILWNITKVVYYLWRFLGGISGIITIAITIWFWSDIQAFDPSFYTQDVIPSWILSHLPIWMYIG